MRCTLHGIPRKTAEKPAGDAGDRRYVAGDACPNVSGEIVKLFLFRAGKDPAAKPRLVMSPDNNEILQFSF